MAIATINPATGETLKTYEAISDEVLEEKIARAAAAGDRLAREILDRCAVLFARVLAGALALLNPDTVVLAGGVSGCFPVIQQTFDSELQLRTPAFSLRHTRIARSSFGDLAGVVGAALLPRHDREK